MATGLAKIALHNRELARQTRLTYLVARAAAAFESHGARANAVTDACLQALAAVISGEVGKARAEIARILPLMEGVMSEASDPRVKQTMLRAIAHAELFVNEAT